MATTWAEFSLKLPNLNFITGARVCAYAGVPSPNNPRTFPRRFSVTYRSPLKQSSMNSQTLGRLSRRALPNSGEPDTPHKPCSCLQLDSTQTTFAFALKSRTFHPHPPSPPGAWLQPSRGPGRGESNRWWDRDRDTQPGREAKQRPERGCMLASFTSTRCKL